MQHRARPIMELRDITLENTLLRSYKTVFVDNQQEMLVTLYRYKGGFPVFQERVFKKTGATPHDLLAYAMRSGLEDSPPGRLFVLERTDNARDRTRTRLFWVWASPAMLRQFAAMPADQVAVQAIVLLHPFGDLASYPEYWKGGIDPLKIPNFLELGARYLFKEKQSVAQHFCAVRPGGPASPTDDRKCPWATLLVVPVSSTSSFTSLGHPAELQEALQQIGKLCYEAVTKRVIAAGQVKLTRAAVAGYSRSGEVLRSLFARGNLNHPFMQSTLREVYAFDIMLDRQGVSKQQGYDAFWSDLVAWQGSEADRRIRLYSAEPGTVSNIYATLKSGIARYGGGYHNPAASFATFNGRPQTGGAGTWRGLTNGYEIYSTDNSRSLVVLPSSNFLLYMKGEAPRPDIANPQGFAAGGDYEPALQGHSWFVSRLQSHALFHSGF